MVVWVAVHGNSAGYGEDGTPGMRTIDLNSAVGYECAAVICTAVEIESACVLKTLGKWSRLRVKGDKQTYYECVFEDKDGVRRRVITCQQDVMGMTAASALAMKATMLFHPRYLIMSGICAGIAHPDEQLYGDVLVPDVVWDYSTGKYVGPNDSEIRFGDVGFLPRPQSLALDPDLKEMIDRLSEPGACEFFVRTGPLACGSSVVANRNAVDSRVRSLFPKTVGLDMESYGIFLTASKAPAPRPKALVVKSVCDYANDEKSDDFQKFASFTSSGFVEFLMTSELDFSEAPAVE